MTWVCEDCGQKFDSALTDPRTGGWGCPNCGAEVKLSSTEVNPPDIEEVASMGNHAPPSPREEKSVTESSADTVFQPVLMMESIMDELDSAATVATPTETREPGTETLETDPSSLPSPFLQLDVDAYLLILGADPGQERRPLVRAKTTFGRRGADVTLDDPAISGVHFQIEAFGKEFFVRDLDSRNGTFLNGSRIGYSQLLPGDQVTAGKTTLIFRTSDDRIDRV